MNLNDQQAAGEACVSCGMEGLATEGQVVGTCDGVKVWACFGGCTFLALAAVSS